MRIAAHHVPGTREYELSQKIRPAPAYTPVQPWPEDTLVQWGHGIAPAVPFFEAFPPGTFIRGEGADIAEAEAKAFAQYEREGHCDHLWGRQRPGGRFYANGAGWCRKCRAFRSRMFNPITKLGAHRKPLSTMELDHLESMENDHELNERMDRLYPDDRADREKLKKLLKVRRALFGVAERKTA